jgi:hypothetical protein
MALATAHTAAASVHAGIATGTAAHRIRRYVVVSVILSSTSKTMHVEVTRTVARACTSVMVPWAWHQLSEENEPSFHSREAGHS